MDGIRGCTVAVDILTGVSRGRAAARAAAASAAERGMVRRRHPESLYAIAVVSQLRFLIELFTAPTQAGTTVHLLATESSGALSSSTVRLLRALAKRVASPRGTTPLCTALAAPHPSRSSATTCPSAISAAIVCVC